MKIATIGFREYCESLGTGQNKGLRGVLVAATPEG